MTTGTVFTVSAPSGAGKTTLVRALLERVDGTVLSVSHTTRAQRKGERDGHDYHFVSRETFQRLIDEQAFLEHAEVFDNLYGTAHASVSDSLAAGQDVILEIDWQGAAQARRHFPEAVAIFVLPPSREALESRLTGRGQDAPDVVQRRMDGAIRELSHYGEADYLIVNDDFEVALTALCAVVEASRCRAPAQRRRYAQLIDSLLANQ